MFDYSHVEIPKPSLTVPSYITDYIGDPQTIVATFWDSVHWWMPIISKKRFYNHVMNPLTPKTAELPLLLSCMKLVLWHPGNESQPQIEHLALKHAILDAENAGILSLPLLQAKILLTIHELGHAIYPAAYFSIASCARYGTALGVNKCLESNVLSNAPAAILEAEEKKRAWWAILILDRWAPPSNRNLPLSDLCTRFIQLGNITQSLCTEDPESSSYLPCDDSAFEQGVGWPTHDLYGKYQPLTQLSEYYREILSHILSCKCRNGYDGKDVSSHISPWSSIEATITEISRR